MTTALVDFTDEQLAEVAKLAAERVEPNYDRHGWHYKLHPDEPQLVLVKRNVQGANWRWYGAFSSVESAAIAVESLRMAQAREVTAL